MKFMKRIFFVEYINLITMELTNISHIVKNDTTNNIYLWYKFFPRIGNIKYMALCTFRSTAHKGWYIYKINDMLHLHYFSFSWPLRPVRVKLINLLCRTNWSLISGCIITLLCSSIFRLQNGDTVTYYNYLLSFCRNVWSSLTLCNAD